MKRTIALRGPNRRRHVPGAWVLVLALLLSLLLSPGLIQPAFAQDGTNTGTIHLNTGTTFYSAGQLTNNSSGIFTNDGDIVINGSVTFQTGEIDEPNNGIVTFLDGATATNASDASHIDGPVRKVGDDAFTFPIGDQGHLGPLSISAPLAPTAVITAAYTDGDPTVALGAALSGALTGLSTIEFWTVAGTESVNLTLHWDSGSAVAALSGGNLANLQVAGWDGAAWQELGNDGTTGTATDGTITADGITPAAYQAYAIGTTALDAPVLSVSPTNPDFGLIALGSTGYQTVTISNVGMQPLTVNALTQGGSSLVTRSGGTCVATPFIVAVGASCTVRLSFTPTGVGFAGATLSVTSDGGNPVLVSISAGSVNPSTPLLLNRVILFADEVDSNGIDNGDAHCLPMAGGTVLNNKIAVAADQADSDLSDNSSAACIALAVPDLTTAIGQPMPNLVAGVSSNVPVTVTNIGGAATTGPVTTTVSLPVSVTVPATFSGGNGWNCATSGQTVACVNAGPINGGGSSNFAVPVTPDASTIGTTPGPFSATTGQTAGEVNAANNGPATMTPTTPVAAAVTAPTITSGNSVSIPENSTVVTTVTASGTVPITYSIVGGADAAFFTIDENTGELSFITAPDFENATDSDPDNIYEVTVQASNSAGTDNQTINVTVTDDPSDNGVSLPLRLFLGGAYDGSDTLMHDDLRANGLLALHALTEPYSVAPYSATFTHVGGGGGESIATTVLDVTGNDAIVDWVFLELRESTNISNVVATRAALVQRDGDVVDTDGLSPVRFSGVGDGSYYVAVRHRNHLGVMTATTTPLSTTVGSVLNFTDGSVATVGSNAQIALSPGIYGLWAGDADGNGEIALVADMGAMRNVLLAAPGNTQQLLNYIGVTNVYSAADVNLDGSVLITGSRSDSTFLKNTILQHPNNGAGLLNFPIR